METEDKPRVAIVADEEVAALIRGRAWEPMIWQVGSFWYADAAQLARWREARAASASGAAPGTGASPP